MDWTDKSRKDRFAYELVNPFDIDSTLGWLDGVLTCEIDLGYYTDTRVSGTLTFIGDSYIENSLIRVHHYVDSEDYHNELGTFFVDDDEVNRQHSQDIHTMTLSSMIARVSKDYFTWHYAIAANTKASAVIGDICTRRNIDYLLSGFSDKRYGSAKIYEFGENILSTLFDVCDLANDRLDVDGHGNMTFKKYVAPASKTAAFDYSESNGMIVGKIDSTSDFHSQYNRVGVVNSKSEDAEVYGSASLPSSNMMSHHRRGRYITEIDTLTDLSPATKAAATAKAQSTLDGYTESAIEHQFDSLYVPFNSGEVANVIINGEANKCMLKSRKLKIGVGMLCTDDWKEV